MSIGPLKARVFYNDVKARDLLTTLAEEASRGGQPVEVRTAYEDSHWWFFVTIGAAEQVEKAA